MTDPGRTYSIAIREAFALISTATEALKPDDLDLTVSVTPTFAAKWLIPRLSSFSAVHPQINLQVLATDRISQFRPDGADLAVRYGRTPFENMLNAKLLLPERIVAVGSPALIEKLGSPERVENSGNTHCCMTHTIFGQRSLNRPSKVPCPCPSEIYGSIRRY